VTSRGTDRLAVLANACANPIRVRVIIALTRLGGTESATLADLCRLLVDEDHDDMPNAGIVRQQVGLLQKLGIVSLEETGPQPSQARCWIENDGVFGELADLAAAARDKTQRL
jgi:hypothetical protein